MSACAETRRSADSNLPGCNAPISVAQLTGDRSRKQTVVYAVLVDTTVVVSGIAAFERGSQKRTLDWPNVAATMRP